MTELDAAAPHIDAGGRGDHHLDAGAEDLGEVDDGLAGAGNQLVEADPLNELSTRVHDGDVDVGVQPQMVGGDHAGVSAADHGDVGLVAIHHISPLRSAEPFDLKTPQGL